MPHNTIKAACIAALATAASAFDCSGRYFSFYNRHGGALTYQQLDPALSPGSKSSHLHSFDGGNAIAATMDFKDTQEASCTTNMIRPDLSNYWRPTLFWNGNNTGFYRVPDMYLKIYYKFGDNNDYAGVEEFPEGFMMLAGNAMLRHDDGAVGKDPGPGIKWTCIGANGRIDSTGFPKGFTSCPGGFTTEIHFPTCWNGNPIDPEKPSAHMAYATGSGKGIDKCPQGFQVKRFPEIFIEFWYDVSSFDNQYSQDDVPWVLANGDPTGFGFHADFLNGWQPGVLGKAIGVDNSKDYCNCGCGCGADQFKQDTCFGAMGVNIDQQDFKTCAPKDVVFPGGDSKHLDKLPGCNPIQAGPADATMASGEGCGAVPAPTDNSGPASSSAESPAPTSIVEGGNNGNAPGGEVTSATPPSSVVKAETPSSAVVNIPETKATPTTALDPVNHQAAPVTFQLPSSSALVLAPSSQTPTATLASGNNKNNDNQANAPIPAPDTPTGADNAQCGGVVTVTTKQIVTVTLSPGAPAPTEESCDEAPSTVWTTVQEVVTVTVAPDAMRRRHVHRHVGHMGGIRR